jgi:hypothetical protein
MKSQNERKIKITLKKGTRYRCTTSIETKAIHENEERTKIIF